MVLNAYGSASLKLYSWSAFVGARGGAQTDVLIAPRPWPTTPGPVGRSSADVRRDMPTPKRPDDEIS